MSQAIDLTGRQFGMLTAIRIVRHNGHAKCVDWLCRCQCGNEVVVNASALRTGTTQSCGCWKERRNGWASTRLYDVYCNMMYRCYHTNNKDYRHYGGRGIAVCQEWRDSFDAFVDWALASGYDDTLTGRENSLDRIDVNGPYSPDNCRWISMADQTRNRRPMPCKHMLTLDGQAHSIKEWSAITGLDSQCIYCRIKNGWPVDLALTLPKNSRLPKDVKRGKHE